MSSLIYYFIALIVLIIIFILLRELNCWYWKINDRMGIQEEQLKLQKDTIQLLEKLVKINKSLFDTVDIDSKRGLTNNPHPNNTSHPNHTSQPNNTLQPEKLNYEEIEQVNSKIPDLKKNEIIVFHPVSRVIKRIHKTEYAEGRGWIIVKEFGK